MTVVPYNATVAAPGRLPDAIALAARGGRLLERHGATGVRLMVAQIGGDHTGTLVLAREHADLEAFGATSDALMADPELGAVNAAAAAPDSPVVGMQEAIMAEMPLDRAGDPSRGSIVEVHVSRITPGRLDDLLDLTRRVADHVEARGATNARFWRLVGAGSLVNHVVLTLEFPSVRAWGAVAEAWMNEPEGLALVNAMTEADPCYTEVSSTVYNVIPLDGVS